MFVSGDADTLGYGIAGFAGRPTHATIAAVSAGGDYEPMESVE